MQCPVCRAENTEGPTCRRCRADLGLLWAIEDRRRHCLDMARRLLVQGYVESAWTRVEQARELRRGPDADQLAAMAHLLCGNFAQAWNCYRRLKDGPEA